MAKTIYGPGGQPHLFPDDMDDGAIADVMRRTYGGPANELAPGKAGKLGISQSDVNREKEHLSKTLGQPGFWDRVGDTVTFGYGSRVGAAGDALSDKIASFVKGEDSDLERSYELHRAAREQRLGESEKKTGMTGGLAAGAIAAPLLPFVGANKAVTTLGDLIKTGVAYGGIHGSAKGDDAEERLANAGLGALVGGVSAPILSGAFNAAGSIANKVAIDPARRAMAARSVDRYNAANTAARDFTDAGVDVFPPALMRSEAARDATANLGRSVGGAPVYREVQNINRQLDEKARQALTDPNTGAIPSTHTAGDTVQRMARAQVEGNAPSSMPSQAERMYSAADARLAQPGEPVMPVGVPSAQPKQYINPMTQVLSPMSRETGKPTAVYELLNGIGREAQTTGRMFGWKGDMEDPRLWLEVERKFGPDIAGWLSSQSAAAASNRGVIGVDAMRRIRSDIGQQIGAHRAGVPGQVPTNDPRALESLYGALSKDMETVLSTRGHTEARDLYRGADQFFRDEFLPVKEGLRAVTGKDVAPEQALNAIRQSMQTGGDAKMAAQFFHAMRRTPDIVSVPPPRGPGARTSPLAQPINAHEEAVRAILAPSAGKGIQGIKEFLDTLSPEALVEMMHGGGSNIMFNMQRLLKAEQRLKPFTDAMSGSRVAGIDPKSKLNIASGLLAMTPMGLTAAIGQHAGGWVLSKALMSDKFAAHLLRAPLAAQNGYASPQWQGWMQQIANASGLDKETANAVYGAIKKGMSAVAPDANAMYVGANAVGADKASLAAAQKMEASGADRETIFQETGWFKQPDGKWRMEIDDSGAKFTGSFNSIYDLAKKKPGSMVMPLKDAIDHPELFKSQPYLSKVKINLQPFTGDRSSWYGFYDGTSTLYLNSSKPRDELLDTVLHEVQHKVGDKAGFFYGAKRGSETTTTEEYHGLPGEAEAFSTGDRMKMSAKDRRQSPPWLDYRVPENKLSWGGTQDKAGAQSQAQPQKASGTPDLFTSLEAAPSADEARKAISAGVRHFDFDVRNADPEAIAAIKKAGGKIVAYHVGGGGGRDWKGLSPDEQVNKFDTPEALAKLTSDVKELVAKGADAIHFDNTHRMSGKRLEQIADAIKAGGAGFIAKNNPDKWNLMMRRRPDLKPDYAVVEAAMHDADETQAAYDLHARGVPTYIIGFENPIKQTTPSVSPEYAAEYAKANPWAHVILMKDEHAYEGRGAKTFKPRPN